MNALYLVATPIGNLEDITLRAVRILKEVSLIAAEDTRKTGILLKHFDIKTPLTSYFEHNKLSKLDYILDYLSSGSVALVTDAGTPGINDPGYELVKGAISRGAQVIPIPGPSIVTAALTVSGLPTDRFLYLGYLPVKEQARRKFLSAVADEKATLVLLEAPHRVNETLTSILATLGDRRIAICREMTKIHEEVFRGSINEAIKHFTSPRGEFALVVEGNAATAEKPHTTPDIVVEIAEMRKSGLTARDAISKLAADTGIPRKELYRKWIESENPSP
jgi:16S rRNA (cytidine1402-2'-O)-methyltransferase